MSHVKLVTYYEYVLNKVTHRKTIFIALTIVKESFTNLEIYTIY